MIKKTIAVAAAIGVTLTAFAGIADARGAKAPGTSTIWELVQGSAVHTTLEFAIGAAGLEEALDASGVQYTLFAPTDAAFEKVAAELEVAGIGDGTVGTLAGFLVENDLLDDVLLYHVTEGRRFANSVVPRNGEKPIETLLGASLVAKVGGLLMDASGATSDAAVTTANVSASNGVIHFIDNVLVPLG
jgi:uncharacterized surface protein with fasciclin (FAS1) repeats